MTVTDPCLGWARNPLNPSGGWGAATAGAGVGLLQTASPRLPPPLVNSHRAPHLAALIPGQVPEPQFLHLCNGTAARTLNTRTLPRPRNPAAGGAAGHLPGHPPTHTRRPGRWGQTGLGPASPLQWVSVFTTLHPPRPDGPWGLLPLSPRPVCSLLPQAPPAHIARSPQLPGSPRGPTAPSPGHSGCTLVSPRPPPPPPTVSQEAPAQPQPPRLGSSACALTAPASPSRPNPSARPSTAPQNQPHRPCRPSQLPEGPALLARSLGTLTLTAASAGPALTPHDPARTPPPPGSPPAPPQLHTAAQRPVPLTVPGNRVCSSSSLPAARVASCMGLLRTPGVSRMA